MNNIKHVFVKIEDREEKGSILEELYDIKKTRVQLENGEIVTVDKENVREFKVEENYETDLNGRVENFSETPLVKKAITYFNPSTGKWQTQNYIVLDNIIVSPMVRKNEETGDFEFALEQKINPSMMKNKQYDGQLLEVPRFIIKKENLSHEELEKILEKECLSKYGEEYFSNRQLEENYTAVSQSFTNQLANFRVIAVEYNKQSDLSWYSISSLPNCIKMNEQKPFTSLQTAYALELLYDMYKEEIDNMKEMKFSSHNFRTAGEIKTKEVSPNKYRFGIEDIMYEQNGEKQYNTYATSNNSVQCILTRKSTDGLIQIGLSKQQRSPFIEKENFDEYLYEVSAGMVEAGELFEDAAVREAREETGYEIKRENLKHLGGPIIISLATQELSDFYLCEISNEQQDGERKLDEQENIDSMEWFDLDKLDLEELHVPLPTKYAILRASQYYKELERNNEEKTEEEFEK